MVDILTNIILARFVLRHWFDVNTNRVWPWFHIFIMPG